MTSREVRGVTAVHTFGATAAPCARKRASSGRTLSHPTGFLTTLQKRRGLICTDRSSLKRCILGDRVSLERFRLQITATAATDPFSSAFFQRMTALVVD